MLLERRILSIYLPNFSTELGEGKAEHAVIKRHLINLTQWAYRFSPIVAPDRAPKSLLCEDPRFWGFNIDITGCEKLFQGELELAKKISLSLSQFKLQHRIAIASSLGAAWGLSRYAAEPLTITNRSQLRNQMIQLPIGALRLSKKAEEQLGSIKIRTVKELLKLSRPSLLERFGKEILDRLDQLLGLQHEPLWPIKILTLSRVEKSLDGAVTELGAIKALLWDLLAELLEKLKKLQVQPSQITIQLKSPNKEILTKQIGLSLPSYSHKHLFRLIEERLNNTQVKFAQSGFGIEKLSLIASRTEAYEPEAINFLSLRSTNSSGEKQLGELLDTLLTNLGEKSVLTAIAAQGRLPEDTWELKLARQSALKKTAPLVNLSSQPRTDRPSLLLNKPQPIRAMATLPDGPPFWLKWREKTYEVTNAIGPERIMPEWWKTEDKKKIDPRDYFKVQIPTGAWLWVYRETNNSNWYLQGLWA